MFVGDSRNDGFVQTLLDALGSSGTPESGVTDFFTKSGKRRKISVKATFTRSEEGEKELIAVLSDVTERERATVFRNDVTILVAILVILVCVYVIAFKLLNTYWQNAVTPTMMTYGLLFSLLGLSVFIEKKTSLHPRITVQGKAAKKAMCKGALVAACVSAAMIAAKFILQKTGVMQFPENAPFIDFSRFTLRELYLYLPSVLLQEFTARSVLHEGFIYVFGEKYGWLSILVSSLVFGVVHLPYSFITMAGAIALMGALGMFYQKSRNLLAVSIVHYVAAETAMLLGLL